MSRILLAIGGAVPLAMGLWHGLLTLLDISNPRAFTPTDPAVRVAMQSTRLRFNPRANFWEAWLGFNLSHSLGVVLFGGGLVLLAWFDFPMFARSRLLQGLAAAVALAYVVISLRFWFWGPAVGAGLALVCIFGAAAMS